MTRLEEIIKETREHAMLLTTIYTLWGRTTCPGNGSEPVYDSFAGGSAYNYKGAAASMLCLPKDPDRVAGKDSDKIDTSLDRNMKMALLEVTNCLDRAIMIAMCHV